MSSATELQHRIKLLRIAQAQSTATESYKARSAQVSNAREVQVLAPVESEQTRVTEVKIPANYSDKKNVSDILGVSYEDDPGWQPDSDEYGPPTMSSDADDHGLLASLHALEGFAASAPAQTKPTAPIAPMRPTPVITPDIPAARHVLPRAFIPAVPSKQTSSPPAPPNRPPAPMRVAKAFVSPRLIPVPATISPAVSTPTSPPKPFRPAIPVRVPPPVASPARAVVQPARAPRVAGSMSIDERITQVMDQSKSIPPMMLNSRRDVSTKPLVEGGAPAPEKYPSQEDWTDNGIPPGSNFSHADWQAAKIDENGKHWDVIEMQNDKTSWLNCFPKPSIVTKQTIEDGKVKRTLVPVYGEEVKDPEVISMLTQVFSDCLLVSLNSWPKFVGAAEGDCIIGSTEYRVIRPRRDYLEPERAFRVGAKLKLSIDHPEQAVEAEIDISPELMRLANTH